MGPGREIKPEVGSLRGPTGVDGGRRGRREPTGIDGELTATDVESPLPGSAL